MKTFGEKVGNYADGQGFQTDKEIQQNNLAAAVADLEDNFSTDKRAVTNEKLDYVKALAAELGVDPSVIVADIKSKQGAIDNEWADRVQAKKEASIINLKSLDIANMNDQNDSLKAVEWQNSTQGKVVIALANGVDKILTATSSSANAAELPTKSIENRIDNLPAGLPVQDVADQESTAKDLAKGSAIDIAKAVFSDEISAGQRFKKDVFDKQNIFGKLGFGLIGVAAQGMYVKTAHDMGIDNAKVYYGVGNTEIDFKKKAIKGSLGINKSGVNYGLNLQANKETDIDPSEANEELKKVTSATIDLTKTIKLGQYGKYGSLTPGLGLGVFSIDNNNLKYGGGTSVQYEYSLQEFSTQVKYEYNYNPNMKDNYKEDTKIKLGFKFPFK